MKEPVKLRIIPESSSLRAPIKVHSFLSLRSTARSLKPPDSDKAPAEQAKVSKPRSRALHLALASGAFMLAAGGVWLVSNLSDASRQSQPVPWIVSGAPDTKRAKSGKFVRWHQGSVTVVLDPSLKRLGEGVHDAVIRGFGAWISGDAELPDLVFNTSDRPRKLERDGVNSVLYGPITVPGHEGNLALTVAYHDPDSGKMLEADIIINENHPFGTLKGLPDPADDDRGKPGQGKDPQDEDRGRDDHGDHGEDDHGKDVHASRPLGDGEEQLDCSQQYDVQAVMAHEAGHFYGLGEDHELPPSTMYYKTARCEVYKRDLLDTDESTIQEVYLGASEDRDQLEAAACAMPRTRGKPRNSAWLMLGLVLGYGFVRRSRRLTHL